MVPARAESERSGGCGCSGQAAHVTALVDTGCFLALADSDEQHHEAVRIHVLSTSESLVVPITVLPEVDYMLERRLGQHAALAVLQSVVKAEIQLAQVTVRDVERCVELMERYADAPIGFVDASIVAVAERLGIARILTLDRRHFGMIRPRHRESFELIP